MKGAVTAFVTKSFARLAWPQIYTWYFLDLCQSEGVGALPATPISDVFRLNIPARCKMQSNGL